MEKTMPRPKGHVWTYLDVEKLRECLARGDSLRETATQIGQGITRNAVGGKAHRLGLMQPAATPRAKPWEAEGVSERTWKRRERIDPKPRQPDRLCKRLWSGNRVLQASIGTEATDLPSQPILTEPITIWDLKPRHCRWPVSGEREHTMFCGTHTISENCSYCSTHCRKAYI